MEWMLIFLKNEIKRKDIISSSDLFARNQKEDHKEGRECKAFCAQVVTEQSIQLKSV